MSAARWCVALGAVSNTKVTGFWSAMVAVADVLLPPPETDASRPLSFAMATTSLLDDGFAARAAHRSASGTSSLATEMLRCP